MKEATGLAGLSANIRDFREKREDPRRRWGAAGCAGVERRGKYALADRARG